jgi:hypothetical protein
MRLRLIARDLSSELSESMISYYPRFRTGASHGLVHKLGGLPWGFPAGRWPVCEECGRPMSHLAQFPGQSLDEQSPSLPIQADEVLFVFKCEWDSVCSFWERDGGANAIFSVARKELGDRSTEPPVHAKDGAPEILPELGVASWRVEDDGVPAELEDAFYDYGRHRELPGEMAHPYDWAAEWRTKFCGVPYWTPNGAQQVPPGRLLLQIDNWVQMDDGSFKEVANFCSDGTAFIFIDRSRTPPIYSMVINR